MMGDDAEKNHIKVLYAMAIGAILYIGSFIWYGMSAKGSTFEGLIPALMVVTLMVSFIHYQIIVEVASTSYFSYSDHGLNICVNSTLAMASSLAINIISSGVSGHTIKLFIFVALGLLTIGLLVSHKNIFIDKQLKLEDHPIRRFIHYMVGGIAQIGYMVSLLEEYQFV